MDQGTQERPAKVESGSPPPSKPRHPFHAELPRDLRKEIAALARKLKRDHRALFASDPIYRRRAGQFLTALLPPKPRRRGRPGIQSVTVAIRLLRKFRLQYPEDRPAQRWRRVYPEAIPNYATMGELEKADARQQLRERVRWRLRDRRTHPKHTQPQSPRAKPDTPQPPSEDRNTTDWCI